MIETKLFQTTKKELQVKPKPPKIIHKTYRQLLGLDRPRKQIQIESDNQNDDFLQKLLKEQEKQKKKKTTLKKSHSSKTNKKNKKIVKQPNDSEQLKKETTIGSKNINSQQNPTRQKQLKQVSKEKLSKNLFANNNDSFRNNKDNQTAKSSKQKINTKVKQNVENSNIKIDDSNSIPYMVTNNLPVLNSSKSFQAYKVLQISRKNSQPSLEIKPKLNPETHTIVHNIKKIPAYPEFKANVLTAEKLLSMSEIKVPIVRQSRVFRRQRLFKNEQQEDRFIKSLQTVRPKKYTMPSLL